MSKEVSTLNITITRDSETLISTTNYELTGSKIDIIEAFVKVLNDGKANELQVLLEALKEFS